VGVEVVHQAPQGARRQVEVQCEAEVVVVAGAGAVVVVVPRKGQTFFQERIQRQRH
jgi:hypothetical protein